MMAILHQSAFDEHSALNQAGPRGPPDNQAGPRGPPDNQAGPRGPPDARARDDRSPSYLRANAASARTANPIAVDGAAVGGRMDLERVRVEPVGGRGEATVERAFAVVRVYRLPPRLDLQTLCVTAIRRHFPEHVIEQLRLPGRLRSRILFKPQYSCAGSCIALPRLAELSSPTNH